MNLSRKWLSEFVTVTASDKEFAEAMTLSGSKVEVTVDLGAEITNVVVGKVVSITRHTNSDHMWVCQIDVGREEPVQIVTGAWNIHTGDMIPVALHGENFARHDVGNLRAQVRGALHLGAGEGHGLGKFFIVRLNGDKLAEPFSA